MGQATHAVLTTINFTRSTAHHNQILQLFPGDKAHSHANHLLWGPLMFADLYAAANKKGEGNYKTLGREEKEGNSLSLAF